MPRAAISITAILAVMTLTSPLAAQDYYYDEDAGVDVIVETPRVYVRSAPRPVLRYRPRVYGWWSQVYVAPPYRGDCGTFRYWTGTRCADARFEPPAR